MYGTAAGPQSDFSSYTEGCPGAWEFAGTWVCSVATVAECQGTAEPPLLALEPRRVVRLHGLLELRRPLLAPLRRQLRLAVLRRDEGRRALLRGTVDALQVQVAG